MRSRNVSRIVTAALCLAAGGAGTAAAGPLENELSACTAVLQQQTPNFRGVYGEMQRRGFRVLSKTAEPYSMHGRPVYAYRFQVAGTGKVHVIYCPG